MADQTLEMLRREQESFLSSDKSSSARAVCSYKKNDNILMEDELLFNMDGHLLEAKNDVKFFEKMMTSKVTDPNFTCLAGVLDGKFQEFTLGHCVAWSKSSMPSQRAFAFLFFKKYIERYHHPNRIDLHKEILNRLMNVHGLLEVLKVCIYDNSVTVRHAAKSCLDALSVITKNSS